MSSCIILELVEIPAITESSVIRIIIELERVIVYSTKIGRCHSQHAQISETVAISRAGIVKVYYVESG